MRFMVIVPADGASESGQLPDAKLFEEMHKFNEEMVKAGVMISGEGLHPTSRGSRLKFGKGKVSVTDGPFAESKELIAGFWLIDVKSKKEAVDWMKRAPFGEGVTLEIRQLFDADDFAPVDPTGELRAKEQALREQLSKKK